MIAFEINGKFLDLASTNFSMEIVNPFFDLDYIPGNLVFPVDAPARSRINQQLLGYQLLSSGSPVRYIENVNLYIKGLLHRTGRLRVKEGNDSTYKLEFFSDAGDLATKLDSTLLRNASLGQTAVQRTGTAQGNYALIPVRNDSYEPKYINYYNNGDNRQIAGQYHYTPFPSVVFLLRQAFKHVGYTLTGSWIAKDWAKALYLYHNRVIVSSSKSPLFQYGDFVPEDMSIAEFVKNLRKTLGVVFFFNSLNKTVQVESMNDILAKTGTVDWTSKLLKGKGFQYSTMEGIRLDQTLSNDKLTDSVEYRWASYRYKTANKTHPVPFAPMLQSNHTDFYASRTWSTAWVSQEVTTNAQQNDPGLRLLVNNIQLGYPLGTFYLGDFSLRAKEGLFDQWKGYYDLQISSRSESYQLNFSVPDIFSLDATTPFFLNYNRYLFSKAKVQVSGKRLQPVELSCWLLK